MTTLILLLLGTPLAWWLTRSRWRFKFLLEAVLALPLVLPPTVLGFYLLIALGPHGPIGGLMTALGAIGQRPLEVAATLRASPLDRFLSVALPLARPGFLTASVLGFAHTLGEFGMVLMVGGNIPGSTQVASIAIYDHVEALEYSQAHWLSGGLLLLSFLMLLAVYAFNRRFTAVQP